MPHLQMHDSIRSFITTALPVAHPRAAAHQQGLRCQSNLHGFQIYTTDQRPSSSFATQRGPLQDCATCGSSLTHKEAGRRGQCGLTILLRRETLPGAATVPVHRHSLPGLKTPPGSSSLRRDPVVLGVPRRLNLPRRSPVRVRELFDEGIRRGRFYLQEPEGSPVSAEPLGRFRIAILSRTTLQASPASSSFLGNSWQPAATFATHSGIRLFRAQWRVRYRRHECFNWDRLDPRGGQAARVRGAASMDARWSGQDHRPRSPGISSLQ